MAPSPQPTKGPSGEPHCCPVVPKVQELLAPAGWDEPRSQSGGPRPHLPLCFPSTWGHFARRPSAP